MSVARSSSVNFEAVEQICFQLLSQGENPSFNLVYSELGNKGSSEVVQRYIDQWRRETGAAYFRQRSIPGMPDELVSAADAFMANVWSLSLQQADQVLASQRQALEAEREAVNVQLQPAHRQAERTVRGGVTGGIVQAEWRTELGGNAEGFGRTGKVQQHEARWQYKPDITCHGPPPHAASVPATSRQTRSLPVRPATAHCPPPAAGSAFRPAIARR